MKFLILNETLLLKVLTVILKINMVKVHVLKRLMTIYSKKGNRIVDYKKIK